MFLCNLIQFKTRKKVLNLLNKFKILSRLRKWELQKYQTDDARTTNLRKITRPKLLAIPRLCQGL